MSTKKYKNIQKESTGAVSEAAAAYLLPHLTNNKGMLSLKSIDTARKGIAVSDYIKLAITMGFTQTEMSSILNISLRTLQRYSDSYTLDPDTSSKVLQLKALNQKGIEVFNTQKSFNKWLKSPVRSLDGQTPLSLLDTGLGFQILQQVMGRIEHGIFA